MSLLVYWHSMASPARHAAEHQTSLPMPYHRPSLTVQPLLALWAPTAHRTCLPLPETCQWTHTIRSLVVVLSTMRIASRWASTTSLVGQHLLLATMDKVPWARPHHSCTMMLACLHRLWLIRSRCAT